MFPNDPRQLKKFKSHNRAVLFSTVIQQRGAYIRGGGGGEGLTTGCTFLVDGPKVNGPITGWLISGGGFNHNFTVFYCSLSKECLRNAQWDSIVNFKKVFS